MSVTPPVIAKKLRNTVLLFLGDQAVLWGAFLFALWLKGLTRNLGFFDYLEPGLLLAGLWVVIFLVSGIYWRGSRSFLHELLRINNAVALGILILLLATFDVTSPLSQVRVTLLGYWAVLLAGLWLFRWLFWQKFNRQLVSGFPELPTPLVLLRRLGILGMDLALAGLSLFLAFLLRFDGRIPANHLTIFFYLLPLVVIIRFSAFSLAGLYSGLNRYASIADLFTVLKGVSFGTALFVLPAAVQWLVNHLDPKVASTLGLTWLLPLFPRLHGYPRSVFFIDWLLMVIFIGGSRFAIRALRELAPNFLREGKRTLIVGAGNAGEMLMREIRRNRSLPYLPVGFIDDDPNKRGLRVHGLPVVGSHREIPQLVSRLGAEQIVIAIPSATGIQMRRIVEACQQSKVEIQTLPPLKEILGGQVDLHQVRKVRLEDLLGREPVQIETGQIASFLEGRRVLITGAAGSIGAELVRQVLRFRPLQVLAVDRAENNVFALEQEIAARTDRSRAILSIGDVTDGIRMDDLFASFRPEVVFHAAAYKHVPLMEDHPDEAVKNNVAGTIGMADLAERYGTRKFVFISTDKAVHPTSVMGATKRVAELYLQAKPAAPTAFVSVRFGNVLGSDGSVVPLFQKQIARGGPVTVTHPEVSRFFMTTSEAVQLVLQAASIGQAGSVLLLDMGEPIKILDLACDLITLSGYVPHAEIPIVFTGLRKGEKLHEELVVADEGVTPTSHPKILVARAPRPADNGFSLNLSNLVACAQRGERQQVKVLLADLVGTYRPNGEGESADRSADSPPGEALAADAVQGSR